MLIFTSFGKWLKISLIGRPIVAGYNWILTPASIFAGHFLKEFYRKFDGILTDSLYTNIPTEDAINSSKELVVEFDNVIKNVDFFLEFLNVIL